jgi:hypothetical protein
MKTYTNKYQIVKINQTFLFSVVSRSHKYICVDEKGGTPTGFRTRIIAASAYFVK